jgi:thymidylate synthase (FAD)
MKIACLDHGFVRLLNISGQTHRPHDLIGDNFEGEQKYRDFGADITDIANAARISFDNFDAERTREQDLRLCEYLIKNKHTSPWEMIEIWLEMKLPIFVARQFVRHRTCSINEVSARYSTLPAEWYIPEIVGGKSASNKQGQEDSLNDVVQDWFKCTLHEQCALSYSRYESALKMNIAPEHARLFLHVNHYTHWLWKQDLHNLMHFLSLRLHEHAQIEARVYAQAVYDLLHKALPEAMDLFDKYRRLS